MMAILLLAILLLTLTWQLVNIVRTKYQKHQLLAQKQLQNSVFQIGYLTVMQEKQHNLLDFYYALGHSIAALHIQLQVTQKFWQINPTQAEKSLLEAYQLSSTLMKEVREIVKIMDEDRKIERR